MNSENQKSSDGDNETSARSKCCNINPNQFRHQIFHLKETINKKNDVIHALMKEKEVLKRQITLMEKSYLAAKRKLSEERKVYTEEKDRFCQELLEKKRTNNLVQLRTRRPVPIMGISSLIPSSASVHSALFSEIAALQAENEKLRNIVGRTDEQNYGICVRFIRLKREKHVIWKKFQELEENFIDVLQNVLRSVNDMREDFNLSMSERFDNPLSDTNEKYLEVMKSNANLISENMHLKLELQCLRKDIHRDVYGPRTKKNLKEVRVCLEPNNSFEKD